jgi:hypothetical protein
MTNMTWTTDPAGFSGLRGFDARPAVADLAVERTKVAMSAPVTPVQGTGVPAAGADALGSAVRTPLISTTGTPLGIPSSRRPLS